MSDTILMGIITVLGLIIVAIITAIGSRANINATIAGNLAIAKLHQDVKLVAKEMDGMKDQLVNTTKKLGVAEGEKAGIEIGIEKQKEEQKQKE